MAEQINVFIIYAREDKEIKQGLLKHLNPLKDSYNLNIWHDDYIDPGQEWKPSIESKLAQTDLFLLLVSADFMISEFINQVEFKFAIDRHKENKSIVIPLIIGYCLWDIDIRFKDYTFNLKDLQVLPDEGKPPGEWKTPEQAYNNIAGGIRKVLSSIKEKRSQALNEETKKKEAAEIREENIRRQKLDQERKENLQKQNAKQKEKKEQDNTYVLPIQDENNNKSAGKKILYASVILAAIAILSYFMFRNQGNNTTRKDNRSGMGNTQILDTSQTESREQVKPNKTGTAINPGTDKNESKKKAFNQGSPLTQNAGLANTPVNSYNTFPAALEASFKDASNNFSNLKGDFIGTEDGMKKYKTNLLIRSKVFRLPYILQNGSEAKIVFENSNNSNYESIQSSIVSLLKSNNIKYDYETSASMASDRYTWNNEKFEIYLSTRKYSDNFVELDFSHRN